MKPEAKPKLRVLDHRNPTAKARDAYMAGEGGRMSDATTLGASPDQSYYLRNRIEKAFLAGISAGNALGLSPKTKKKAGRKLK